MIYLFTSHSQNWVTSKLSDNEAMRFDFSSESSKPPFVSSYLLRLLWKEKTVCEKKPTTNERGDIIIKILIPSCGVVPIGSCAQTSKSLLLFFHIWKSLAFFFLYFIFRISNFCFSYSHHILFMLNTQLEIFCHFFLSSHQSNIYFARFRLKTLLVCCATI